MVTDRQLNRASLQSWLSANGETNSAEIAKLVKALPFALDVSCTEKQRDYVYCYFADNMTVSKIAELYGVNPSTVSRQIHSALKKCWHCLRFVSPSFMTAPFDSKRLSQAASKHQHRKRGKTKC